MNQTLKAIVRYDGTDFAGWQVQPGERTVQGEIEQAFARIAQQPVPIQGAGRTDSGVHALGQVFSCVWPGVPPKRLRKAVSKMLSPEIQIVDVALAPPDFSARFSAHSKRYCYSFDFQREADPMTARYAWNVPYRVDLDLMQSLLPKLEGKHDFAAFQSAGTQMKSTVRTLFSVQLRKGGGWSAMDSRHLWLLEFHGDGFLYRMVRNISGTLVEIARGRFPASFLDECLDKPGPFLGYCAPARGLVMAEVLY